MHGKEFLLDDIKLEKSKVFRDAVHNYIYVDNIVILKLIDTVEFQRLRRIKQLGGTHQVYQSAEHTRFSHSMGVYQITKMMCKDSCIGKYLSDFDKLTVQCAALLHDVGHGPFSHCFESVFDTNHEEFTVAIINGNTEIHDILEGVCVGFSKLVSSVISKTHDNSILVSMVSSEIDADRMDYLLRDSYFTGTTYGQFDLQRILRVMDVSNDVIVYKESGVQAIEDYILARYHMYWQVYYHPTARSYEQLLLSVFNRVKDLFDDGFDLGDISYLLPFLKKNLTVEDYINLDESVVLYYFKKFTECSDKILKDLSSRFLKRDLFLYQDYTDLEFENEKRNLCDSKGLNSKYYVVCDDQVQLPYKFFSNQEDKKQIFINKNNNLIPLPDVSEIVWALTNSKKRKEDHKIFFPNVK